MALRICLSFVLFLSFYSVNAFLPIELLRSRIPGLGFSWGNCGAGTDPIQLKALHISPDPIKMPGNITLNMTVAIASALPSDIRISLELEKKVSRLWIKVPCKDNVGSCNYGNVCAGWAKLCPKYFAKYGFPCTCPIAAGTYSAPTVEIDETKKIPSQADGDFKLTATISGGAGRLGCIHIDFKLKS